MFCKNCGEENPENAVYCRNCGTKLIEEVKKTEVIETPPTHNNQNTSNTNTNTTSNGNSDWIGCCLCLVAIFIIFAIFGGL